MAHEAREAKGPGCFGLQVTIKTDFYSDTRLSKVFQQCGNMIQFRFNRFILADLLGIN